MGQERIRWAISPSSAQSRPISSSADLPNSIKALTPFITRAHSIKQRTALKAIGDSSQAAIMEGSASKKVDLLASDDDVLRSDNDVPRSDDDVLRSE